MPRLLLILCLLFSLEASKATHIVGGDFYYDYLGNNQYRITLKLYVDCINGSDKAIESDRQAIIGIFDGATGNMESTFLMTRGLPYRLDKLYYECVRPPRDVCVDGYTYQKTLTINPGRNGKILAFQRCCRNNSITNIYNPESTGSTYWIKIPPHTLAGVNNAARFNELPPNYLCTDAPLMFDHSAIDPDGDSLIYELYNPYLGATRDNPRPANTDLTGYLREPPFQQVRWKLPYNTYNQMSGDPRLSIDRYSGELRVTPSTVGQFVIGIKVKEYRNGVLIGETYRDYQFNVKNCTFDLVAAFAGPVYSCSDTVIFENKSFKAVNYRWDFGDPTTNADTSNEVNPTYVYPGNGDYRVTLKAWNEVCEDEYSLIVKIRSDVRVNLGPDLVFCSDVDRFLDTRAYDATKVVWNNGMNGPVIRVKDTGLYVAEVYYEQCFVTDSIHISTDPVDFSIPSDSLFCEEVDMLLDAGVDGYKYRWSTSPYDTFRTLHVTDPGWYWVRVSNKHCYKVDSINLFTFEEPDIGPFFFVCNEFEKRIDLADQPGARYLWDDGSTDNYRIINDKGTFWVNVQLRHCEASDTLIVQNSLIDLELGLDTHYCDEVYKKLVAPEGMVKYYWSNESPTRITEVRSPGKYFIDVVDSFGCTKSDTIILTMSESPSITLGDDTSICSRTSFKVSPGEEFVNYIWSHGPQSNSNSLEIQDAGTYSVVVYDKKGCKGTAEITVKVDPNALPNELFIPNAFTPNSDNLNEVFPYSTAILQPEFRAMVFNRWGQKVFDSVEDGPNWDAAFQGDEVHQQAFMYLVEYRGCDGEFRRKSGTVIVLK